MGQCRVRVNLPGLNPDDRLRNRVGAGHEGGGHGDSGEGSQRGLQHLAVHHSQREVRFLYD